MSDFNFAQEEYLTLRKEVETHMAELGQIERNCILATAAVYAWLAKDGTGTAIAGIGWYIPVLFAAFGALRSLSLGIHLSNLSTYIRRIEHSQLANNQGIEGWEHYLLGAKSLIRRIGTIAFWIVLLITTILIGILA